MQEGDRGTGTQAASVAYCSIEPRACASGNTGAAPKPKAPNDRGQLVRQISKLPNQKGVPEGSSKWFCSACMKSFVAEGRNEPHARPQGHPREAADEFAAVPQGAAETD